MLKGAEGCNGGLSLVKRIVEAHGGRITVQSAPGQGGEFIEHRAATLTREELLNEVWGCNAMPSTRTVDVHVAWLRQKIEPNPRHPQYVLTVHGMGYKFAG